MDMLAPLMASWPVQALGLIALTKLALSALGLVWATVKPSGAPKAKGGASWAVVTGATDGIGKAVATELYRRGYNLVLVSRTMDRLQSARAEIAMSCTSRQGDDLIKVVQFDFSTNTSAAEYAKLKAELPAQVSVLYNNVGVSYDHAMFVEELSDAKLDAILEVNMRSMVKLTSLVLPGMLEANSGAIINIGSAAGSIADPLYSVYSGSKAFVEKFSESMAAEVGGRGKIIVQDHIPFFVATKLAKIRKASLFAPSPADWAKSSVSSIGCGGAVSVPYLPHKLQAFGLSCIPTPLWNMYKFNFGVGIRKKGMKKAQEKAKSG